MILNLIVSFSNTQILRVIIIIIILLYRIFLGISGMTLRGGEHTGGHWVPVEMAKLSEYQKHNV